MADIELVIKISEEDYDILINHNDDKIAAIIARANLWESVKNGTPLPKGHGRLIDADELELDADWDDYYDGYMAYSESMIKYAPTIIDADKESD